MEQFECETSDLNDVELLSVKIAFISKSEKSFSSATRNQVLKFFPELERYLVPYSTSVVIALAWQMYRLPVNLHNFSSCFSNFIRALFL